ncbi:MAG: cytochrome c-type biogenesis protein CcmH [Francisellaceae bacterium]|mgnify:CR=1 FL=1|jgi:cytochrome c-type biogenesis protein CcmH|nr:cytochrome c-type biogenesis protein CcmH [Francisellaceae bacterium]MBT6207075.1 cytochrome c-type biogenesis protein CcmH [Francisellaceae bacterium]MBT6537999.1 cytochrome c-type biogenesis protein CcmH [Francisellaceae bacterium]
MRILIFLIAVVFSGDLLAIDINSKDRIVDLSQHMRCLTCNNQSIFESDSPFALEVVLELQHHIETGKTDQEIYSIVTDEYGDNILYDPKMNRYTLWLWTLPFIFLSLGLFYVIKNFCVYSREQ